MPDSGRAARCLPLLLLALTLAACSQQVPDASVPPVASQPTTASAGVNPQAISTPVMVYKLSNYGGWGQALEPGTYNLPYNQATDNDVSSLKVPAGFQLKACADLNLGGLCTVYTPGNYDFVGADLNNTFSSLQITVIPPVIDNPAAVVYPNVDFGGVPQPFLAGRYNLPYGAAYQNDISSLKISAGMQVKACSGLDLSGTCTVYGPGDYATLGAVNDTVSSLEISVYVVSGPRPTVYQLSNYGGRTQVLEPGTYNLPYNQVFDNDVSSLKVPAGFQLKACADFNLGGLCTVYAPGNYDFVGAGLNNTFSSLQVTSLGTATQNPSVVGAWSQVIPWPLIPIHAALNPDGQVMTWSSVDDDRRNGYYGSDSVQSRTQVDVWDSLTGAHRFVNEILGNNIFCAGFVHAADGTLITVGGNIRQGAGTYATLAYNYGSGLWKRLADMTQERWYSSATNLANGEILAIGAYSSLPEVFNGKTWRTLTGAQDASYNAYYPWTQAAPNGKVFYAGPSNQLSFLDTAGAGQIDRKGQRDDLYRDYGSYAMYDTGKVLVSGGNRSEASAKVIDINTDTPVVTATSNMKYGRRQHNLTILADGQVLATGGNSNGTEYIDLRAGVYPAELWNPLTGAWKELASLSITRQYHSFALLLPDGRVMVGGGGYCCDTAQAPNPVYAPMDNPNVEYFSPPYLFDAQGTPAARPAIAAAPVQVDYNQPFAVTLGSLGAGNGIAKLHLIRLGSVTHSVNMEQRLTPLAFSAAGTTLNAVSPINANVTPPGFYMLIAVNDLGVPSVAKMIQVGRSTWTAVNTVQGQLAFESGHHHSEDEHDGQDHEHE